MLCHLRSSTATFLPQDKIQFSYLFKVNLMSPKCFSHVLQNSKFVNFWCIFKLSLAKPNISKIRSETGLICFQQFFRIVNTDERNLLFKKDCYYLENPDLVGIYYLWSVIISSSDAVALKAIEIMQKVHIFILYRTDNKVVQIHEQFIKDCLANYNISKCYCDLVLLTMIRRSLTKCNNLRRTYTGKLSEILGEKR